MRRIIALALLSTLAIVGLALQQGDRQDADPKFKLRELKNRKEFEGTVVCIGCTLQKQEGGANAQCTLHSKHAQGLLMKDKTLWTLVDNDRGHMVITNKKMRGKTVKINGWSFPKAQYIEISKYKIKKGDEWIGYDYCKT